MHPLEQKLKEIIDAAGFTEQLHAAISHSQMPPGKMIRGLLALALCEDLGGSADKLMPAAAALELLHTSSLIHDDLPAMDNDDMRRGRASCHKAFDEATAILAGDALVALAHNLLTAVDYPAETKIKFVDSLSRAYIHLCNGQELDLKGAKDKNTLELIHNLKTAALFSTSLEFGALGAGANDQAVKSAAKVGRIIGLSFQIVDDFLDNFADEKGRKAGSDKKNDKKTFNGVEDFNSIQSILNSELHKLDQALVDLMQKMNFQNLNPTITLKKTYPLVVSVWDKVKSLNPSK
jgi:geranylgeranyl pyrophosphate synthase